MTIGIREQGILINPPAQVIVRLTFGRPSKKCSNFGICNMELITSKIQLLPNTDSCISCQVFATLANITNQHCEMTVIKTSKNNATLEKYFGTTHFLVEEDYELPFEIRNRVGGRNSKIAKGIYRVIKKPNSYAVSLQLE